MTFTVISMNLWPDPFENRARTEWVEKGILAERPDVVLFQQVTNSNVLEITRMLRENDYKYKVYNTGRKIYELIGSRWQILDHGFKGFSTTYTTRGMLWALLSIGGRKIIVAACQLEQRAEYSGKRAGQLECILKYLGRDNQTPVIVGCDTGFRGNEGYPLQDDSGWYDAWLATGRNKYSRYTIDPARNKNVTNGDKPSRPDRIYYRNLQPLAESTVYLVGTEPECGKANVNPSTHFGLKMVFV